jgi:excisionase family DNA binding protein
MSICNDGLSKSRARAKLDNIEPLVVKPQEAWRLLSCSRTYGYELIAAGALDSFKDGKIRKITVSSIKAYIDRQLAAQRSGSGGAEVRA